MKRLFALFVLLTAVGCAPLQPSAPVVDSKPNYSGRDFTKANPNEGFPSAPVESAGEGADMGITK